jgi:hypothetical protein
MIFCFFITVDGSGVGLSGLLELEGRGSPGSRQSTLLQGILNHHPLPLPHRLPPYNPNSTGKKNEKIQSIENDIEQQIKPLLLYTVIYKNNCKCL